MKLVLCSEGFHTANTVQACVELVGKPQNKISVAVINEAYAVEEGDKYWVLDNLNSVAKNFKSGLDIINLLKAAKTYPGVVYGLRDDSALVVNGAEQRLIGSEPVKIVAGKAA